MSISTPSAISTEKPPVDFMACKDLGQCRRQLVTGA